MRLKSVVFPVPLRPMMPHLSPEATVNVTSLRIDGVAELHGDAGHGDLCHPFTVRP